MTSWGGKLGRGLAGKLGRKLARCLSLAAGLTALCLMSGSIASGYYNFVYFTSRNAPFTPVPVRFDLNALVGSTVSYFISDQPPSAMMPGDSYAGIVSQIVSAAAVWNGVSTSALRLSYGGVSTVGTPQSTPGIDVVFSQDVPAGLLAYTIVTTPADASPFVGGGFVPLLRSKVQLRSDLTATVGIVNGQPSYSELFYTTLVHEFGHAQGLQHALVSGAMATQVTRATTKGSPLTADDVAAVSMLYPATGYVSTTGSISGRVTLGSGGVNLASVVALSTNGTAISGMTNPDGTYTINGIPPGQYYVYVHPLPPPQNGEAYPDNIVPPVDLQGNPFPAVTGFGTLFYPGTRDWTQAKQVGVSAGVAAPNINFAVQGSSGPAIYDLQTYAGAKALVPSPYLVSGSRQYLVFTANGALVNGTTQLTPGLSVSAIGGAASTEPATLAYYQQGFLYEVIDAAQAPGPIPVALAVTTNTDLYVLPAGVTVTPTAPPTVTSVNGSTDGLGNATVNVAGANLTPATDILFDGTEGTVLQQNSDGSLTVAAPMATGAYQAFVEAVNPDGQSSAQALGTAQPLVFTYASPANPALTLTNPAPLTAGTDVLVDITSVNTEFVDGQAAVGFASSDVQVRRVWVASPTHLMANVTVTPQASAGPFTVSVQSGLQLITLPGGLQVQPPNPQQISLRAPVVNLLTNLAGVPAGGTAVMGITGLPAGTTSLAGWTMTIGGVKTTPALSASGAQIQTAVPNPLAQGAELVHLVPPAGDTIPQIALQLDAAPPDITSVTGPGGFPADQTHPVGVGDTVSLTVFNLGSDPTVPVSASSVNVMVAGVSQSVAALTPLGQQNAYSVQVTLSGNIPAAQDQVTVGIGTRRSASIVAVHN
jgi:hypothetical protein